MKSFKEKKKEALIRLWAIFGSFIFLYQSVVVFFTIYINGYSTERVIINLNVYGEMLYETIMFGCVMVIALICFVYSVISTILHFKKKKRHQVRKRK